MRSFLTKVLTLGVFITACGGQNSNEDTTKAPDKSAPQSDVIVPRLAGAFAPAFMELGTQGLLNGEHLSDVDTCGGCHPDLYAQQQLSAHASSSFNNPVYRFAVDLFRDKVGKAASQMCGGCHDIALMVDGAMHDEVKPDDERAHAGITCRVCHGIESATNDGNGSFVLSRKQIQLPIDGDAESIERHKKDAAPMDSELLCGSCHRSFLSQATGNDHFLAGMDDLSDWKSSAYNHSGLGRIDDEIPKEGCVDCHMRMEPAPLGDVAADKEGRVRSHRFLGGHTWLASMLGDEAQLARQQEFLRGTMTLDIAAVRNFSSGWVRPADGAPVASGDAMSFDIVMRNVGVGHKFPGGVRDAVDSWLEVTIKDAEGTTISQPAAEKDLHRLRVLMGGKDATPQLGRNTEDFYEVIVDHTIAARDARVVRYEFTVPKDFSESRFPLHIESRLIHRSRNLEVQQGACEAYKSERGRAFSAKQQERGQPDLNPCLEQPKTVVAEAETWIGKGANRRLRGLPRAMPWKRLYEHALGLLPELPREASVAKASLEEAIKLVSVSGEPRDQAMIYAAMGAVYAGAPCGPSAPPEWPSCAGRLKEGLAWLGKADAIVPGHPAISRTRARLYERSWLWPEAAKELAAAAAKTPENAQIWRTLSTALVTVNKHGEALTAAQTGLALIPRDDDLLRVQALALENLHASLGSIRAAKQAYETHKRALERPEDMRSACAKNANTRCALERFSVHSHKITLVP